jgi:chromosomal replication initiation ATPase DnaA
MASGFALMNLIAKSLRRSPEKLNSIHTLVAELHAYVIEEMDGTLFAAAVRDDLRQKLSEMVPYDYILNRATEQFRVKCNGLNQQCKPGRVYR